MFDVNECTYFYRNQQRMNKHKRTFDIVQNCILYKMWRLLIYSTNLSIGEQWTLIINWYVVGKEQPICTPHPHCFAAAWQPSPFIIGCVCFGPELVQWVARKWKKYRTRCSDRCVGVEIILIDQLTKCSAVLSQMLKRKFVIDKTLDKLCVWSEKRTRNGRQPKSNNTSWRFLLHTNWECIRRCV